MGRLTIEPKVFSGEVPPTKSVLQVLLELRHPVMHSCRRGLCGQDLIRVTQGWEFLNAAGENERGTLELFNAEGPFRMACCTRVIGDGEAVVEIV